MLTPHHNTYHAAARQGKGRAACPDGKRPWHPRRARQKNAATHNWATCVAADLSLRSLGDIGGGRSETARCKSIRGRVTHAVGVLCSADSHTRKKRGTPMGRAQGRRRA